MFPSCSVIMYSVESLREFISDRLSAAAVEIFSVVEQTIVQYQEEVERRVLDVTRGEDTKTHTTGDQSNLVWEDKQHCKKEINSNYDQVEPQHPQIEQEHSEPDSQRIKNEEEELQPPEMKEEPLELCTGLDEGICAENFMMTATDEQIEHKELGPDIEQLISYDSAVDETQEQKTGQDEVLGLSQNAEQNLNSTEYNMNAYNFPIPQNQWKRDLDKKCFICVFCEKTFKLFSDLQVHNRTHMGEKPYSCETCGKTFQARSQLRTHKRSHVKPFSCEICGKCFSRQRILSAHMTSHTGEKPYSCETCGKGFGQLGHLFYHRRIHTGEKPYSCETCGKSFGRKDKLNLHKKIHAVEKSNSSEMWK